MRIGFFLLCSWFCLLAQAQQLPAAVTEMLNKNKVAPEDVSIWVQGIEAGVPLVDLNGKQLRHPASVEKVLTTASDARGSLAVDILGRTLGWQVEAPKINLIRVAAAVVNEEPIALVQEAGSRHWWTRSTPLPRHIEVLNDMTEVRPGHHRALLLITHRPLDEDLWRQWPEHLIVYRPPAGPRRGWRRASR